MIAAWEDLDEEQDVGHQEEETEVANLCFIGTIEADEETKVEVSKPKLYYDELSNTCGKLLNESHVLSTNMLL